MSDLVERLSSTATGLDYLAVLIEAGSHVEPSAVAQCAENVREAIARITELETALAEARNAALEEAAKVAEDTTRNYSPGTFKGLRENMAQAIRALASDPLLDRQGKEGV